MAIIKNEAGLSVAWILFFIYTELSTLFYSKNAFATWKSLKYYL